MHAIKLEKLPKNVLIKGGHLKSSKMTDILINKKELIKHTIWHHHWFQFQIQLALIIII